MKSKYNPFNNQYAWDFLTRFSYIMFNWHFCDMEFNDVTEFIVENSVDKVQTTDCFNEILTICLGEEIEFVDDSLNHEFFPKINISYIKCIFSKFFQSNYEFYLTILKSNIELIDDMFSQRNGHYDCVDKWPNYSDYLANLKARTERILTKYALSNDEGEIIDSPFKELKSILPNYVESLLGVSEWYLKLIYNKQLNWKNCVKILYEGLTTVLEYKIPQPIHDKISKILEKFGKNYDETLNHGTALDSYAVELGDRSVNVSSWADPKNKKKILSYNDIILPIPIMDIEFSYPLLSEVKLEFYCENGFSLYDICRCINEGYSKIYKMEEDTVGDPGTMSGLYNREISNGPIGIWGHSMCMIFIEGITINPRNNTIGFKPGS